jgi:formamidopyrimidine-DNA glycosylase
MPELPEVETIRRSLAPDLVGRRITGVQVHRPAHIVVGEGAQTMALPASGEKTPEAEALAQALTGQRVAGLDRRGKFLVIHLDSGERLVIHLRMTGSLLLRPAADPLPAHASITWTLDDGKVLHLTDLRRFATVWLVPDESPVIAKLGPEPLDTGFTADSLAASLARRKAPVKAVLLDQGVVAGLGNIYVDEALFEAGVHPQRPASSLTRPEIERLHAAITGVIGRGITNRGTSLRSYRDGQGARGRNQESLRVFRRTNQPCPNCGTPIQRLRVGGRATHFCPSCQPA